MNEINVVVTVDAWNGVLKIIEALKREVTDKICDRKIDCQWFGLLTELRVKLQNVVIGNSSKNLSLYENTLKEEVLRVCEFARDQEFFTDTVFLKEIK